MEKILCYMKNETGKMKMKFVPIEEAKQNPDYLLRVQAEIGDYSWTDEAHMEQTKEKLLEGMFDVIRSIAKHESFWIIKGLNEYKEDALTIPPGFIPGDGIPQEAKDGKVSVAWKADFTGISGRFPYDEAMRRRALVESFEKALRRETI